VTEATGLLAFVDRLAAVRLWLRESGCGCCCRVNSVGVCVRQVTASCRSSALFLKEVILVLVET